MKKENLFTKTGMGIKIPLNYKGYLVRANILRYVQTNTYEITFEIGHIHFSNLNEIEGDVFTLESEKGINFEVFKFTMDKFADGYFKPFIDRYDFEQTALSRGIEIIEEERCVAKENDNEGNI